MLSLSRCPSKKRKMKKSSLSESSSSLIVDTKSNITSMNLDEKYDGNDEDISNAHPRSSAKGINQSSKTKGFVPFKENEEQQVQKLKRQRDRKRRRQMRMESALESILKPSVLHSDTSELKRMENRFWNDDDSSDNDDVEKHSSYPPASAEPSCHAKKQSQEASSDAEVDGVRTPPDTASSNNGNEKRKTGLAQGSNTTVEMPVFPLSQPRQCGTDTKLPQASQMLNVAAPSRGRGNASRAAVPHPSAWQNSPNSQPKDGALLSTTKGKEQKSPALTSTNGMQMTLDDDPDSGEMEFEIEDDTALSYLQAKGERTTCIQSGQNASVPNSYKHLHVSDTKYDSLESNGKETPEAKTSVSNQPSHEAKDQSPFGEDVSDGVTTTIPQSDRDEEVQLAQPVDKPEPNSRSIELSARNRKPGTSTSTFHHPQAEPMVTKQATKRGIIIPQVPNSEASESSPTLSTSKSAKSVRKQEIIASNDADGAPPKKKQRKRVSKTSKLPPTECIEVDADCDHGAPKVSNRGKKRGRKGLCALCTTCPCRKTRSDDTAGTLGLQSFARSDSAMEKALIRRLKKIEKSCENLQDQQETIKRKLKKHRRDIVRKKVKVSSEDKGISYFLPDVEELETSEWIPSKVADDWISHAQKHQPSLTQLGFSSSKSKKKAICGSELSAAKSEAPGAPTDEPHHDTVESVVNESEIGQSQLSTNECDKIEDHDSKAMILELTPAGEHEPKETRSDFEEAHRIIWQNSLKLANDMVATSALEGLVVHSEEVEDANSVLSLTQEQHPMGRIEPCPWDSLFSGSVLGDEINDIDHLVKLIDGESLCSTQEPSANSICGVDNSVASCFDLTQRGKEAAEALITKISSDFRKVDALKQVCPNWKENVSFAFGQTKGDIQDALKNLQDSRTRLDHTKQMILDAWNRKRTTMDVFMDALEKSLDSSVEQLPSCHSY
ncbi:MAG: hypothetical protein SGBAC_002747 [Bacillariaceae sp.]